MSSSLLILLLAAQSAPLSVTDSQRAEALMRQRKFADAVPIYELLVKSAPGEFRMQLNLGVARYLAGDVRSAVPPLESAVRLNPDFYEANLFLGLARMDLGEPEAARPALERATSIEPANWKTRLLLADALLSLGRNVDACVHLQKVLEANAGSARAWYLLGRARVALARESYSRIISGGAKSGYELALMGEELMRRQQYPQAFSAFRLALAANPELLDIHARVAEIYRGMGKESWAKQEEDAAAIDCRMYKVECDAASGNWDTLTMAESDTSERTLYWRGHAFTKLADQAFAKLETLPESPELHRYRAGVHWEAGRKMEMVTELRLATKLAPQDRDLKKDLCKALGAAGFYDESFAAARELLKREPDSAELNHLAGNALLSQQLAQESIPYLDRACHRVPGLLAAQASLGRALLQTGQAAKAIPHLEAATPIDRDGSVYFQLSRAYTQVGDRERAKKAKERHDALALPPSDTLHSPGITPPR